jgi:hypothetical protein
MKKKLESELISIAHRILKLKGKEDVIKLHAEVAELYEKLTVFKFAQENFDETLPTIGDDSSFFGMLDTAFNNTVSDTIEIEDKIYVNLDDDEQEDIMEPVMEKIKDMVAQMPEETQQIDVMIEKTIGQDAPRFKSDFEEITAGFQVIPEFEPIEDAKKRQEADSKKSLNDTLKNGLKIDLNDRIAFIKHLFNGNNEDYDRVLSQINTTKSFKDAQEFINSMVKPDHNNWEGKEDYETRFLEIVESKFN